MAGNIVPRTDGGSNLGTSDKEFNVIYAKSFGGTIASQVVTTNSPVFTGTPAAPTAAVGTNTTQLATTAFANSAGAAAASSAVATHNAAADAHSSAISIAVTNAVNAHNGAADAHSDIRTALAGKANSSALAGYLPLSGGTLTGALGFSGTTNKIDASSNDLTWGGKEIKSMAFPSSTSIAINVTNNSTTTFTAPANGFVWASGYQATAISRLLFTSNLLTAQYAGMATDQTVAGFIPVKKDTTVSISVNNCGSSCSAKFFYSEGEV